MYDDVLNQIISNLLIRNHVQDSKRSVPEFQAYSPWSQMGLEDSDRASICGGRNFHGTYILTLLCNSFRSKMDSTSANYHGHYDGHYEEDRKNHPKYTL